MSKKDSTFKYVSGDTLSTSDTNGLLTRPRTLLPVTRIEPAIDQIGRKSLTERSRQSPQTLLTALRHKSKRDSSPDSWPKRNPIKRSGSCVPSVGGRLTIEASTSESRLDHPQRQDSMELCWSEDIFRVEDLVSSFGRSFPLIVKVVHGYSGGDGSDLDLEADQVVQLHTYGSQSRVTLKTSDGPEFSLPLTYPISCRRLSNNRTAGPSQTLERTLLGVELPQDIQVTGHAQHADESSAPVTAGLLGSVMTVTSSYMSNYVTAHVIKEGWLNTTHTLLIPQELNAVFRIALGIKGAEPEVWIDYTGMFARTSRGVKSQLISGYPSIIYSSWSNKCHCCRLDGNRSPDGEQFVDESNITISSLKPLMTSSQNPTSNCITPTSSGSVTSQYLTSSELNASANHHGSVSVQPISSRIRPTVGSETSTNVSKESQKVVGAKTQLKRRNSSYIPPTPLTVVTFDGQPDDNTALTASSCLDLSAVLPSDQFPPSPIGNRTPTKRSVPYMGTRDITHKFTYCNFKVSSTPKSVLSNGASPSTRGHKQLTVRFSPGDSNDAEDKCIVEFSDDNSNSNCYNQNQSVIQDIDESDFMNSLSLSDSQNKSEEQRCHLSNGCDSAVDNNLTLASVCDSIDDGYDTKESTMSSAGSVSYRKQYSPVYF